MTRIFILSAMIQIYLIYASPIVDESNEQFCNNGQGKCVHNFACDDDKLIKNEEKILENRFGDECDDESLTCCPINVTTLSSRSNFVQPLCGFRNANGIGNEYVNENEAKFGEFPWAMALMREEYSGDLILNVYLCGASLISSANSNIAMTAAHCLKDYPVNVLKVRAGEWDTRSTDEMYSHVEYKVQEIVIHENYNSRNLHNDIALLILTESVKLTEHINTICLPPQNYNFDGNKDCIVTGWGKDKFGKEGRYQNVLKKIEVPIVPSNECQSKLRETNLGIYFKLHESFMCAGDEQNDSCKGDGGSALFCSIEGKPGYYYQVGIVSWGIGCGSSTGVFVNVAKFRSWIDSKIQPKTSRFNDDHYN